MTNEEMKKEICKIIADNYLPKEMPDRLEDYKLYRFARAADALIAAGIGDVKEAEMAAIRYEMLYNMQARDMVLAERKAYNAKHRAEVAERALLTACGNLIKNEEDNVNMELLARVVYKRYLEQAEKELAEEEK